MARTVRGGSLETRSARLRLTPRGRPYWVASAKQGLHLGYRRLAGKNGPWLARTYQGRPGAYTVKAFATADDYAEAEGAEVLPYYEAMRRVSSEAPPVRHGVQYTVDDAVNDYIAALRLTNKSPDEDATKLRAYFLPYFGGKALTSLQREDFDRWLAWAVEHKPKGRRGDKPPPPPKRKRKGKGKAIPVKPVIDAAERRRRKHSTLNRVINPVKACLNLAFENGRVLSDAAWRHVKKFKGVDAARSAWLTTEQSRRLINACSSDFRKIVHAALLTGARWGELRALQVRDYDARSNTIHITVSKADKPRRVPLTDDGSAAFESWTAGRPETALIFTDAEGEPWDSHDQVRRMASACAVAKIEPTVGFHVLRHSYASSLVQAGVSLAVVAEALGHADTRMVSKHYGHLSSSHIADAIRANLRALGVTIDSKVTTLRP